MENGNIVLGLLTNGKKVLIGRLKDEKIEDFGGNEYVFPGGKVKPGENEEKALSREIKEGTGLDVEVGDLITQRIHPDTKATVSYYSCFSFDDLSKLDTSSPKNDDIAELMWVDFSLLKELMPSVSSEVIEFLRVWNM